MKEIINQLASHDLLQDIVEGVPIRIFWKDRDSRYLGCNSLFAQDAGLSHPDELIGKTDFDMSWKDQAEAYRADDFGIMESGDARLGFEESQTTPDGQTIWLRTSKVPLRDQDDTIIGILGTCEDITSRKLAKIELLQSEQRLKQAQSISGIGIWDWNLVEDQMYWSDEVFNVLGYTASETEPSYALFREHVHSDDRDSLDAKLKEALEQGGLHDIICRFCRKDSSQGVTHLHGQTVYDEQGHPKKIMGTIQDITKSKRVESSLKRSEAIMQNIFNNLQDAYYRTDADGILTMVSPSNAAMMGCTADDLLGTRVAQYYVDERQREQFLKAIADNEGVINNFEVQLKRFDGEIIWVSSNAHYLFDDQGNISGLEGMVRDISERKRSEESVRHLLNLNELILSTAGEGIYGLDNRGKTTFINPAGAEMIGWGRDELIGMNQHDVLHHSKPDGSAYHRNDCPVYAAIKDGKVHRIDNEVFWRKDGNSFPVEYISTPMKDESGAITGAVVVFRDITERKGIEEKLRLSEERFALAMAGANDGLWDWNLETDEVYYSPRWLNMLGYEADSFPATLDTWAKLVHPDDKDWVLQRVSDYLEGRADSFDVEMRMSHKDGHELFVLSRASKVLRDSDGKPMRLVGTHVDISERKHAERQLVESEQTYRGIFNSLSEAVYVLDANGCFLDINEGAVRMYGFPHDYFIGKNPGDLSAPNRNNLTRVVEQLGLALHGEQQTFEFWAINSKGEEFPKEVHLYPGNYFGQQVVIAVAVDISERKQAQAALIEGEERLAQAQSIGHVGVWDWNPTTGTLVWTEETFRIFGYKPGEVEPSYELFLDHVHPDDRDLLNSAVESALHSGKKYDVDCHFSRLDGSEGVAYAQGQVTFDDSGQPVRMLGTFQDISERKQTEEKLHEEMEFRSRLLDQASEGITVWHPGKDGHTEFLTWNRRMQEITGYTREEINKLGWLQTVYANDHERNKARETMQMVLAGGINRGTDFHIVTRSGEDRTIHISSSCVQGNNERLVLAVIQDITESRQQQSLLEASRKKFITLFNSSHDSLFIHDLKGNILDVNRITHERLGYSKNELLCMSVAQLDTPEMAKKIPERIDYLKQHGAIQFESAQVRKNGTIMPIEVSAQIIELDGKKVIYSVARDISERKEFEEQLRQSQKMEAIGTLVGGIAHDFNNMLAAMQGNIYLAKLMMQSHPMATDKLDNIEKLGNRAADMVQQLLTFARKDSVSMRTFSLNAFMKEGYKLATAGIPENIDHQTSVCNENLLIKGDITQLQQVLMNLLNNAVDAVAATPQPKIRCSLTPFESDKVFKAKHPELVGDLFACISVKDNGHGISADKVPKIFEPFFTTKEVGKGTGLGLAMLYGAIQTHGGLIDVQSEVDKGTLFSVYLPLNIDESEAKPELPKTTSKGTGETILLVDDEEDLRTTTGEVLTKMGYQVIEAADGEEALDLFKSKQEHIDLIISDIIMPRMGGSALLKAIRQLDETVPVILVTGYDKDNVLDKGIQSLGCLVLNKPFNFDTLSRSIKSLIKAG